MRWQQAAAAAAGVVAAVGLSAHKASADDVEAPPPDAPPSTTTTAAPEREFLSDQQVAQLRRAQKAADTTPADGPVHTTRTPAVEPAPTSDVPAAPPHVDEPDDVVPLQTFSDELVSLAAPFRGRSETSSRRLIPAAAEPLVPAPLEAAPADDAAGKRSTPAPASSSNATVTVTPATPKATPPPAIEPVSSDDAWYPAWVTAEADQRIAERWLTSPVRGPPPSTATALGNDARNTTTQVAVVRDQCGNTTVAVSSQTATVHNVGVATAEGHGLGGTATATGNTSDTRILQVSVIELRGTGSATVEQSASVDNIGTASATTAGAAGAAATGNDSQTSVTQIAVVYVEGSGDAHLTQSTDVDNMGVATAEATDRDATAVGNTSSTDVTQIAVVHVSDDDVHVGQTSTTSNIGVATAIGGTASGNTATNTTTQVVKVSR